MAQNKSSAALKPSLPSRAATKPHLRTSPPTHSSSSRLLRASQTKSPRPPSPLSSRSLALIADIICRFGESVFEFDPAWKLLSIWSANEALGFQNRSQLLGQTLSTLFGEPSSRFFLPLFRRLRPGASRDFVFSLEIDSQLAWFAIDLHRTAHSRFEPRRLVLRIRNITALHRAESRLQTTERRLEHAEENAEFGSWEYHRSTGEFLWSKQLARMFRIPLAALPLRSSGLWQSLHVKDIQDLRRHFEASVRSGRQFTFSEPYTRSDGSVRAVSGIGTPMTDANGKVLGMFGITRDVTALAHTQADVRRLAYQLLDVRSEEQRRIGRDLHDTTSQTLASLKMTLAEIGRRVPAADRKVHHLIRAAANLAGAAIHEVRFVSSLLHPPLLEEAGLFTAINSYSKLFAERGGVPVSVNIDQNFGRLENELELTVFRIVQEALTNVHRHARATSAIVSIERHLGFITVEVRDDGIGLLHLLSKTSHPQPLGIGLAALRERVAELHGRFDIRSSPGAGTTLRAEIPIDPKENSYDPRQALAQGPGLKTLPHPRRRRSRHRPPRNSRPS